MDRDCSKQSARQTVPAGRIPGPATISSAAEKHAVARQEEARAGRGLLPNGL